MITHKDQLELFRLIATKIDKDIVVYAFGGTAMMFYGYKEETKDIDLLFMTEEEKKVFIDAIEKLGYSETSLMTIYIPEKLRDPHRPVMYKRDESRFDLFVKKIFRTVLSPNMVDDKYAVHDFTGKFLLRLIVFRTEHIVLLKAITERDKDFEDILTIIKKDKNFEWQYFIDEVLWQAKHGNSWAVYDVEKMLLELKKYIFIEEKYVKQLYGKKK